MRCTAGTGLKRTEADIPDLGRGVEWKTSLGGRSLVELVAAGVCADESHCVTDVKCLVGKEIQQDIRGGVDVWQRTLRSSVRGLITSDIELDIRTSVEKCSRQFQSMFLDPPCNRTYPGHATTAKIPAIWRRSPDVMGVPLDFKLAWRFCSALTMPWRPLFSGRLTSSHFATMSEPSDLPLVAGLDLASFRE